MKLQIKGYPNSIDEDIDSNICIFDGDKLIATMNRNLPLEEIVFYARMLSQNCEEIKR